MIDAKKRLYIILGALAVIILVGLSIFISLGRSGTLELTAPDDTPNNSNVTVKILRNDEEEQSLTLQPGETRKLRIGTGTVRVDGQADVLRAVDIVHIRGFATTKLRTPEGERRVIQQLASDAVYCPVIVAGITYSYGCDGEGPIKQHTPNKLGNSVNTTLFEGTSFSQLKPIKNGLIGFYATVGAPTDLIYIDLAARTTTIVQLPEAIRQLIATQPEIAVTNNPQSSRFALVFDSKNKIFVFKDITDTKPFELRPGEGVRLDELGRLARVSFSGDNPILYAGASTDIHEGEGDGSTNDQVPPELTAYLFEYSSDGKLTNTITLPDSLDAQNVYKLGSDFYIADHPYGFGFYQRQGNELESVYTLNDMGAWVISGTTAYVQSNGILYEFKPNKDGTFKLRSLFASSDITVSSIYGGPQGILFTGLPNTSADAPLNIYRLSNEKEDLNGSNQAAQRHANTEPEYSGLDDLLYFGLSSSQVSNLRYALSSYVATRPAAITSVVVSQANPEPHDRNSDSTVSIVNFNLILNNTTTLKARLEYFDLQAIRLYLYSQDGALVYDSQVINRAE